ncbi:MAG: Gfo/Idh/MocA family protein [Acidimicrobiales bacterium]
MTETYGHTDPQKMFELGDVYGIGFDPARAARRPLRLGIIGAGGVAQSKYLPAITRLRTLWEPVEVVAVADPDETQGRKVECIYGARWYHDHRELIAGEKLDGVIVTVPDDLHAPITRDVLTAGIAALVEKPCTTSLGDARGLCDLAARLGVPLMPVANLRFSPPHRRARRLIDEGTVDRPHLFVGKMNMGYDYVHLLEDTTVHLFDLARYFMGDVDSVTAAAPEGITPARYPVGTAVITLRFASGAVGLLHSSSTALSLKPWYRVEVYAHGSWLEVDDIHQLSLYDSEQGPTQTWRPVFANTLYFDEEFSGYTGLVEEFLATMRGERAPAITGEDGLKAYELVAATHLALATGQAVRLPLAPLDADSRVTSWLTGQPAGAGTESAQRTASAARSMS